MLKKDQHLALDKSVLRNYVELPHIFKKLNPGDKFTGLAHIAEIILSKNMTFLFKKKKIFKLFIR